MREAEPADMAEALQLVRTIKRDLDVVVLELQHALGPEHGGNPSRRAFVASWQDQVVGVAVIG